MTADVVIVGGGIAGLAAAWELHARGCRPLVLEQRERPGGVIFTERADGFVIDAGPDALLAQKPAGLALARELGLGDRLVPSQQRTAFVLWRGRLVPLPDASQLGLPTRLRALAASRLLSWRGKLRLVLEPLVPRGDRADEAIGAFIGRRFGREVMERIAEPLLAGIHAGDVNRLSMRALFPRLVEAEHTHGSVLRGLRSRHAPAAAGSAFVSLPGGLGELVAALVDRLPPGTVRCSAPAIRIDGRGPYRVEAPGGPIDARALVLAVPAWAAASLLDPIDEPLAAFCRSIPYVSTATVALGFRRRDVGHPLRGSGFVVPRAERRAPLAVTWVSSKWAGRAPEGTVLLRVFYGGARDPDALAATDEDLQQAAVAVLAPLLDLRADPILVRVYRWPRGTAQYEVGHLERLAAFDERLTGRPGLFVTGSGFRGTGIPDCIGDARAVAAAAAAFLASGAAANIST